MQNKYDVLVNRDDSLAIETIASKITSLRNVSVEKKGARIFKAGKIYSASVVGQNSTEQLLQNTEKNAVVGLDYQYELPKNSKFEYRSNDFKELDKAQFVDEVNEFEKELATLGNKFVFTGKHKIENWEQHLTSSEGVDSKVQLHMKSMSYIFKKIGSPNLMDGFFYTAGETCDIKKSFNKIKPYLEKFDQEVALPNGEYPILIADPESGFYSKLLESFYPHKYFEGTALYSGKIGQKLFHQDFTLIDHAFLPKYGVVAVCDQEGTKRSNPEHVLIENGVMKNVIADLRYAEKYKIAPTGNGKRSFDGAATVGFNAVTMKPGKRSTQTILNELDKCIVAFMAFGGDFTDSGDFSTPVHLGFLVEKGKIVGKIPQVTLTTSLNKMFNDSFLEIASDDFFESHYHPSFFQKVNILNN